MSRRVETRAEKVLLAIIVVSFIGLVVALVGFLTFVLGEDYGKTLGPVINKTPPTPDELVESIKVTADRMAALLMRS